MCDDILTITFPAVKVEVPIEGLTFDILENMIFDVSQLTAQKTMEKALDGMDNYLRVERARGELTNTGKKKKTLLTRFGDIVVNRTRYLLDEALSTIKNQRTSLTRAMMECLLSTLSSYREVVGQARLLLGHARSHESIRRNILSEAKLIIEHEKERLQQIENFVLHKRQAPEVAYTEADATYIKLQKPEKDKKLMVKIGIGYHGKENRYQSGISQRLKEKFVYTGFGGDFMYNFSLRAEEELNLSQAQRHYFAGDGDRWITGGIRDYFPQATYLLCRFHLERRICEALPGRKPEQKTIRGLLNTNQIDEALSQIDQLIVTTPLKGRKLLINLYTYIANNREGIINQVTLKDKDIARTGAIESNVNTVISSRLKKGKSWSKKGALSLLKVKETIINNSWENWWHNERFHPLKLIEVKPPLPASFLNQEDFPTCVISARIPALTGPHQGKPWVCVLRKLSQLEMV